jgi:ATP-dependent Clp protease ATP-binding subunit ClpA
MQNTIILLVIAGLAVAYVLKKRSESTPQVGILANFTRDLTDAAKKGMIQPVVGRSQEVARTIEILCRKTKNNPLLLGEPGVGKTAITEGLAVSIARGEVPDILKNKRLLALDLTSLISDTKYRGEFEKRVRGLVEEVRAAGRQVILFIDEIHMLAQARGAEGSLNVADILKPALARGELLVIGATTPGEYRQYITLDRRFQPILVPEPSEAESLILLKGIRDIYGKFHGVRYDDQALELAVKLSKEFAPTRFLPDRAIDLVDEAGARVKIEASHGARHAAALAYFAGEDAANRRGVAAQHRRKLLDEIEHLKDVEKMLAGEAEAAEARAKLEHLAAELERLEKDGASDATPVVTADDIRRIVEETKR